PCTYRSNRFKRSCGKSDAFFRSIDVLRTAVPIADTLKKTPAYGTSVICDCWRVELGSSIACPHRAARGPEIATASREDVEWPRSTIRVIGGHFRVPVRCPLDPRARTFV